MPIDVDAGGREFHLHNGRISYIVGVHDNGALGQLYFGPALSAGRSYRHLVPVPFHGFNNRLGAPVALEYPTSGSGDYRVPAIVVGQPDGSTVLELAYVGHRITPGKPAITGLPATYVEADEEADTLEIDVADGPSGAVVTLLYTIFRDVPIVARSVRIRNAGPEALQLRCAMSLVLDLPDARWQLVHLGGTWARERHVRMRPLELGRQSISSSRGASSHEHNPFVALRRSSTSEEHGEAIGAALVYSGNFLAEVEVEPFGTTRIRIGIDPETFGWRLEPGAEFVTPEAVIVYSDAGMGALSDALHRLFRERLARGSWRDRPRPVLVNSWEGTYFDFDAGRLLEMASVARDLGIELFVLDDGWFGERDDDTTSLGDWFVDRRKLPHGLDGLARSIEALGLRFGLWIEPEMVSRRSRLFEAHPDWVDRRTWATADRGPAAARPGSRSIGGRRSPLRGAVGRPRQRADLLCQVGHEPEHDGTVQPGVAAGAPGRVLPSLHPRRLRAVPARDGGIPGGPLRVVRRGRRAVRRGAARIRPPGVDERRYRCDRAAADPVGLLAGVSHQLDGCPRVRGPEPPGGPDHPARDARRGRVLSACSATSSTRRP